MKKIIFILILFLSCFGIYISTTNKKLYYLNLGDGISLYEKDNIYSYAYYIKKHLEEKKLLTGYNDYFTNEDYRIVDLIHHIEENTQTTSEKSPNTMNQLIKKADIITLSIGMNELYYKLTKNTENIYTYVDNMLEEYENLLKLITSFSHKKVYIIGFYNVTNKSRDVFTYANYHLSYLAKKYNGIFIDMQKIINRPTSFLEFSNNFILSQAEYQKISQNIIADLEKN